ncbi:hypothetical protein D3C76_335210 [compost metagenome]
MTQFVQASTQQIGQVATLIGWALEQADHVHHQHHAVERTPAATACQPVDQVMPQALFGASRQPARLFDRGDHGFGDGFSVRRGSFDGHGGSLRGWRLPFGLADELTGRVDQHRLIADPPIDVERQIRVCGHLRRATARGASQGETLAGAADKTGLAGVLFSQHQIPRNLMQAAALMVVPYPRQVVLQ